MRQNKYAAPLARKKNPKKQKKKKKIIKSMISLGTQIKHLRESFITVSLLVRNTFDEFWNKN